MGFAIFRIKKMGSVGQVHAAIDHCQRAGDVPNADPARRSEPLVAHGRERFAEKLQSVGKVRKNAVMGVDVFLGASPEFFEGDGFGDWNPEKVRIFRERGEAFLRAKFGGQIVSMSFHCDEKTPHFQAIVIPLVDGKLNARAMFGGREKMIRWQDEAAEAFEDLGLARGVRKSRATHASVRSFYGLISKETPPLPRVRTPAPVEPTGGFFGISKEEKERYEAQKKKRQAEMNTRARAAIEGYDPVQSKAKVVDLAEKRIREVQETLVAKDEEVQKLEGEVQMLRATVDEMRGIDLGRVITEMFAGELEERSKEGHATRMYRVGGAKIGVTQKGEVQLWIDNLGGGSGRGAIDLVKYLSKCDFKSAVRLLDERFGEATAGKAIVEKARETASEMIRQAREGSPSLPAPDDGQWPKVRSYMEKVRGIPERIIDGLKNTGKVYADHLANLVFRRENGGAFLRGTSGPFKQTRGGKEAGPFLIDGLEHETVLCESPIDAISYRALRPESGRILALGGNLLSPGDVRKWIRGEVVLAFDRDQAGEKMALRAVDELKGVNMRRDVPDGKDWNEDLQMARKRAGMILSGDESTVPLDALFGAKPAPDEGAWPTAPEGIGHDDQGFPVPDESSGPGW